MIISWKFWGWRGSLKPGRRKSCLLLDAIARYENKVGAGLSRCSWSWLTVAFPGLVKCSKRKNSFIWNDVQFQFDMGGYITERRNCLFSTWCRWNDTLIEKTAYQYCKLDMTTNYAYELEVHDCTFAKERNLQSINQTRQSIPSNSGKMDPVGSCALTGR